MRPCGLHTPPEPGKLSAVPFAIRRAFPLSQTHRVPGNSPSPRTSSLVQKELSVLTSGLPAGGGRAPEPAFWRPLSRPRVLTSVVVAFADGRSNSRSPGRIPGRGWRGPERSRERPREPGDFGSGNLGDRCTAFARTLAKGNKTTGGPGPGGLLTVPRSRTLPLSEQLGRPEPSVSRRKPPGWRRGGAGTEQRSVGNRTRSRVSIHLQCHHNSIRPGAGLPWALPSWAGCLESRGCQGAGIHSVASSQRWTRSSPSPPHPGSASGLCHSRQGVTLDKSCVPYSEGVGPEGP